MRFAAAELGHQILAYGRNRISEVNMSEPGQRTLALL
jgi:hypothetical protein